ncbi:partial Serine/threonine-protein kinase PknD, partial [Planctomycetaceae bacterium]
MKPRSWVAISILAALATVLAGCGGFPDIEINPAALPAGAVGVSYSVELQASGGAGKPWSWSIEGELPPGLAFIGGHEEVYIRGTPTTPGTYSFKIVVTDLHHIKDRTYSIVISGTGGNPLTIVTTSLPNGSAGQVYSANVTAQGGSGTGYAWLIESGSLPPGLSLAAGTPSATISGTPPAPGGYVFTLRVTDSLAATATRGFSISVGGSISISTQLPFPQPVLGVAYSASLTANGGTGTGHIWSISQGALPPGLTLGASGSPSTTISGTPTTVGNYQFTVMVVDDGSNAGILGFNIDVSGPLTITTTSLPSVQVGGSYVESVNTAGGSGGPYTWSIVSGALPPGLSIGGTISTGTISGVPSSAGTFNFTVQVQDAGGSDTQALSIVVIASGPVSINTTSLPSAEPGAGYSATITASGGTSAGYTWSIIGGSLPPGLTLASSGTPSTTITGTAGGAGDYVFDVRVIDSGSNSGVKQFTLHVYQSGEWLTIIGNGTSGSSGDGGVSYAARANGPRGCCVDAAGNLYFCDTLNHKVRRIDAATRVVTTVAGTGIGGFTADGIAAVSSALNQPYGIWVDGAGNLFIADSSNNRVRRVDAGTGLISTVAGTGGAGFAGDGGLATSALLDFPIHV